MADQKIIYSPIIAQKLQEDIVLINLYRQKNLLYSIATINSVEVNDREVVLSLSKDFQDLIYDIDLSINERTQKVISYYSRWI